jgi:hypothetical protein
MFGSSLPPVVWRVAHVLFTLFTYSGVQHMLCCVFVLFFFVLCTLCCQFLRIVHSWLPNVNKTEATLQSTGGKDETNIVFVRTLLEVKGYYFVCNSWLITIRYSPTISRVSTGRNYGSHELFISHIKTFWLFPNNYITANQLIFTLVLSTLSNFCLCCWTIAPRGYRYVHSRKDGKPHTFKSFGSR